MAFSSFTFSGNYPPLAERSTAAKMKITRQLRLDALAADGTA